MPIDLKTAIVQYNKDGSPATVDALRGQKGDSAETDASLITRVENLEAAAEGKLYYFKTVTSDEAIIQQDLKNLPYFSLDNLCGAYATNSEPNILQSIRYAVKLNQDETTTIQYDFKPLIDKYLEGYMATVGPEKNTEQYISDEFDFVNRKAYKRIHRVKMQSVEWVKHASYDDLWYGTVSGLLETRYDAYYCDGCYTMPTTGSVQTATQNTFRGYNNSTYPRRVYVKVPGAGTTENFKQFIKDKYIYAKATHPQVIDMDEKDVSIFLRTIAAFTYAPFYDGAGDPVYTYASAPHTITQMVKVTSNNNDEGFVENITDGYGHLVYKLTKPYTSAGDTIDTGWMPYDEDKNWTIVLKYSETSTQRETYGSIFEARDDTAAISLHLRKSTATTPAHYEFSISKRYGWSMTSDQFFSWTGGQISTDGYHYLVLSKNGDNYYILFDGGVLSSYGAPLAGATSNLTLRLFGRQMGDHSIQQIIETTVYDFRIYDQALTGNQCQAIYMSLKG